MEEDNLNHLQAELCGLALANIYMNQLKCLAKEKILKLPGELFNN
jgi:hypothetical protein